MEEKSQVIKAEGVQQIASEVCQFFVVRKNRQCKFQKMKGSKYCNYHCSDLEQKIQCPYEKGTFIMKSKFEKHLQNCPRIRDKKLEKESLWYKQSINQNNQEVKGGDKEPQMKVSLPAKLKEAEETSGMISRIIELFLKCFEGEELNFICSTQKEDLSEKTKDHMQAELIAEKASNFNLLTPKMIFVEFGAGKGILSYAIANKIKALSGQDSKNILLERQARRNKFDKFFKDKPYFQRYKSDVSDFDFSKLPETMVQYAQNKQAEFKAKKKEESVPLTKEEKQEQIKELEKCEMIGVCKHMCGQALDISVRGLLKSNCKGNILASCCHHLCNYHTYLNPKFFTKLGWTPEETQILFKMSSWGTRSHKFQDGYLTMERIRNLLEQHSKHENATVSYEEKIVIGRMCKRIIDYGRADFVNGKLYRYCSDQLTPENFVIISN